ANLGNELLGFAKYLDDSDINAPERKDQLQNFDSLLLQLKKIITSPENEESSSVYYQINVIETDVNNFYNEKIENDISTFDTAYKFAEAKFIGDSAALHSQLTALQGQIDSLNSEIA